MPPRNRFGRFTAYHRRRRRKQSLRAIGTHVINRNVGRRSIFRHMRRRRTSR